MFYAYDDEGLFAHGTKKECCDHIVNLAESGDLEHVYSEYELSMIVSYFNGCDSYSDDERSYSGFTVSSYDDLPQWAKVDLEKGIYNAD